MLILDLSELNDLPKSIQMSFDNADNLFDFTLKIIPDEGFYLKGVFVFSVKITINYPHEPPKVTCQQKIYHPNIDVEGNVCLNILREDWKPVLSLHAVFIGLQYLFLEPNADDPLNKQAAIVLRTDRKLFARNVLSAMAGGSVDDVTFDHVLIK